MTVDVRKWQSWTLFSAIALLLLTATVMAAGKAGEFNPNDTTVDMFAAIEKGDIAVQLSFKDSTQGKMRIENKTDKPLNVKLPDAFAGLPILAQRGVGGGGGRSSGGKGGGGSQGMGGGMGGMGGMGGGMGMMNVPPEKVGQLDFAAVCLEHGKHDPRPNIPYEIKPLDSFTTTPGVRELCQALGTGQVDQRAAQAAAWHLNNGMSWDELTAKRIRHANGTSEAYFSPTEIQAGMQLASAAVRTAQERQKQNNGTTPSLGNSSSQ